MTFDSKGELWPVLPFGFDPDDGGDNGGDGSQGNQQSNDGAGQGNSQQNQQGNQQQQSNDDDDDDADEYEGLSAKELRRIAKDNAAKAKAAEKERDSAKSTLTAKEREKLDKEQRLELESEEKDGTIASLRGALSKQALINGILSDRRFEWHNPEIVAAQLNSSVVKVDDDGKVEGLAKDLKRIANDETLSFLLAKDNTKQNDGNQQQNGNQQQQNGGQQTGLQPGQGGANQGGSMPPNANELAELMPALRNRM